MAFHPIDRNTEYLLPPSVQEWLPEAHLARYVVDVIEAHLKAEVRELLDLAEAADQSSVPDGVKLPDEIKRREDRLAAIAVAKGKIEARAKERFEREQAEHNARMAARAAKAAATNKKPRGRDPQPPESNRNRLIWASNCMHRLAKTVL